MDSTQKKRLIKEQKIPIVDAWSLVAMADRINDGKYIKLPEVDPETGNIALRPNREIIKDQITLGLVNVSAADREFGERMAVHFQGLAFNALNGSLSDFDQKIINMLVATEIDAGLGMALLACMAARYRREVAKEEKQDMMIRISGSSTHQGSVGQHLRMNVTVLNKYEGKAFPGSVVRATDGTNLYFWSSSKMIDMWPDSPEQFPIVGVIKAHGQDRDGTQETRLTRVKIVI